jgi:hypothetical protein
MANPAILRLNLLDVYGRPIDEKVDILIRHTVLSEFFRFAVDASGPIDITNLTGANYGPYKIEIDPPSFQMSQWFVNLKPSGITSADHTCAIDPKKVLGIQAPAYGGLPKDIKDLLSNSDQVSGYENTNGQVLYDALLKSPIPSAGLLNIICKCRTSPLGEGKTVLPAIAELTKIEGDRIFARVSRKLIDDTKDSVHLGLFHSVDGSLHPTPSGFKPAGSYKTSDHYGNLQLTFFANTAGDCLADIDIDDAAGIEHIFQVLHNAISGEPTNTYNIHEILMGYQGLDPGYRLKLG